MKLLLDTHILDRLLAATARHYGLRLVTADERLLRGSGFSTVAN